MLTDLQYIFCAGLASRVNRVYNSAPELCSTDGQAISTGLFVTSWKEYLFRAHNILLNSKKSMSKLPLRLRKQSCFLFLFFAARINNMLKKVFPVNVRKKSNKNILEQINFKHKCHIYCYFYFQFAVKKIFVLV